MVCAREQYCFKIGQYECSQQYPARCIPFLRNGPHLSVLQACAMYRHVHNTCLHFLISKAGVAARPQQMLTTYMLLYRAITPQHVLLFKLPRSDTTSKPFINGYHQPTYTLKGVRGLSDQYHTVQTPNQQVATRKHPHPPTHTQQGDREQPLQVKAYGQQPSCNKALSTTTPAADMQCSMRSCNRAHHSQQLRTLPPTNSTLCTALHLKQHQPWIPPTPRVPDTHLHQSGNMHLLHQSPPVLHQTVLRELKKHPGLQWLQQWQ